MKNKITVDDFKYVMTKHKDLILFLISEDELKYGSRHCGILPELPDIVSINIWNEDLYGDTWLEWKNDVVTEYEYDGHFNDYRPFNTFHTIEELDKWMSGGFVNDHKFDLEFADQPLKERYLKD